MLKVNDKLTKKFISNKEVMMLSPFVDVAHSMIHQKSGVGSEFLGWLDLPNDLDQVEYSAIKNASKKIQEDSNILIVIGIGGSYLGAKSVLDFLNHSFENSNGVNDNKTKIYFAGHNISATYINDLEDVIEGKDFSINIISKSGTTTEPALAFRHFKNILIDKYGQDEANRRIYATTDAQSGALKTQAVANNWTTFVVPNDVGGRFSVLTAVGLLPIAASGIDINQLIAGAKEACNLYSNPNIEENVFYKYDCFKNILYNKGKNIELLVGYEPGLNNLNEWWKQLFGESIGKDGKGLFPASVIFSTDLHSMGQYIQEGRRDLFETVISIKKGRYNVTIEKEEVDGDGLNYLAGKSFEFVNQKAFEATAIAHVSGNVPNIVIELDDMSAKSLGHLIYFFQKACAISGYLLGINPFDQPGVEEYKKNMFALLGKPGFEQLKAELDSQI